MPLALQMTEIEERIEDLLESGKDTLGLKFIETGEANLIPEYPAVSVAGRRKRRRYAGTRKYALEFVVDITVQFEKIQSSTLTQKHMEPIAEAVDKFINDNRQLEDSQGQDPIVIQGIVSGIDYGVVTKREGTRHAARLTYEALSQEVFA